MTKAKNIVWWLYGSLMIGCLLMLAACSDDSVDEPQGNPLQLSSVTREGTTSHLDAGNIKVHVTTKTAAVSSGTFSRTTPEVDWTNSGISIKENAQYYLYGFMPSTLASSSEVSATASDLGGDFSKGADLQLTALPTFTTEDICVIVGVQRITEKTEDPATEGNYGYAAGVASQNYVNLLMDHLYSKLILQFNVDANYYLLRHIKLKKVTLTSTYGKKVNATIKLRTGKGLANAVVFEKNTGFGDSDQLQMFASSTTEPAVAPINLPSNDGGAAVSIGTINCAPCIFDPDGMNLSITCEYDVYDTKDAVNPVREGCTATNKLKVSNVTSGVQKTVTVTIAPTYLYVLSDNDLNNPTIYVGTGS